MEIMEIMEVIEGNILDSDAQYIAHQCNCLTSHSAGTAKVIFDEYPDADIYKTRGETDWKNLPENQKPGQIIISGEKRKVINMLAQLFPGKAKFPSSQLDGVSARKNNFKKCLDLISKIEGLKSVDFPYGIGCNMAGGHWPDYLKMIEDFSEKNKDIQVRLIKKVD